MNYTVLAIPDSPGLVQVAMADLSCPALADPSGAAQVITNRSLTGCSSTSWTRLDPLGCGCRRWRCTTCGAVQHHARPLPKPGRHW